MSIEAMKQALEALEAYQHNGSVQLFDEAITSLRQAIAEAEKQAYQQRQIHQLEKMKTHILENAESLGVVLDEAEKQEPVALETVYETIIHWDEGGGKRSRRELARRIEALYTHPQPKPSPLTDEQWQVMADTLDCVITRRQKNVIESAIGIKGEA